MSTKFPNLAAAPVATSQSSPLHIVKPGDASVAKYFQVPGLHTEVLRFLAMHRMRVTKQKAPRLMAVVGPQGSGKSEGVLAALLAAGCHVAVVSPNQFSSETENGATLALDTFMEELQRYSTLHRVYVQAVLEDADTSILARDEKTSVTPGHRMLAGRLQFLADHRDIYTQYTGETIGLVLTANRPDELRASLLRNMRALYHEHNPNAADIYDIVFQMIDPRSAEDRKLLERVFAKHKHENLSFWSAVAQAIAASPIDGLITDTLPDTAILDAATARRPPLDADLVWKVARSKSSNRALNYFMKKS